MRKNFHGFRALWRPADGELEMEAAGRGYSHVIFVGDSRTVTYGAYPDRDSSVQIPALPGILILSARREKALTG